MAVGKGPSIAGKCVRIEAESLNRLTMPVPTESGPTDATGVPDRDAPSGSRPPGGLLRTRNIGLLWVGESTSAFGSAITTVALPLVAVSTLHASPAVVTLITASSWL